MHGLVLVSINLQPNWSAYLHPFQRYDCGSKFKYRSRDNDHAHSRGFC